MKWIPGPDLFFLMQVHFPGSPTGNYWVLATDYENYSAVYTCFDLLGIYKFEYAWLLTREREPSAEVVTKQAIFFKGGSTLKTIFKNKTS